MSDHLDDFLDEWERAYQADQELAAQGVPPDHGSRRELAAAMNEWDEKLTSVLTDRLDPSRDERDLVLPAGPRPRPQALWQKIN